MGQLVMILRAKYLVDAQGYNKIQGKPFKTSEIEAQNRRDARLAGGIHEDEIGRKAERFVEAKGVRRNDHSHFAGLHQERFSDGPGNSLVPRLRRLRDSIRRAVAYSPNSAFRARNSSSSPASAAPAAFRIT